MIIGLYEPGTGTYRLIDTSETVIPQPWQWCKGEPKMWGGNGHCVTVNGLEGAKEVNYCSIRASGQIHSAMVSIHTKDTLLIGDIAVTYAENQWETTPN